MLDAGCWMLDAGCWMLDAGCWMLDAGCWMLGVRRVKFNVTRDGVKNKFNNVMPTDLCIGLTKAQGLLL
jgi:hypothetical protein